MADAAQDLIDQIEAAGEQALRDLEGCADPGAAEQVRVTHMGKKGPISLLMRQVGQLSADDKPAVGKAANQVKARFAEAVKTQLEQLEAAARAGRLATEGIDVTLPGRRPERGRIHPLTAVLDELSGVFTAMGFEIASGPCMEDEHHNFDALNIPKDHPARDMQDTFYLRGGGVLRTHTSPVQIRGMLKRGKPPIALIAPGKVFRCENPDNTHSPVFHQIEGLLVDEKVRLSDLKGVIGEFLHRTLGPKVKYRMRPSYFPFTEPSAEFDIWWKAEGGQPRWTELLGSGMVHPRVLEAGGIDPKKYTGFAFGLGVERYAMVKYGIPGIKLFYENDLRFLRQF